MEDLLAQIVPILAATLRVATPLVLCAMGGLFSERSGLIDVGLEGKMLAAAFAAAATAAVTGSPWLAVAAAILAAEALALLHGFACITYRGNQVVSGVAINILWTGYRLLRRSALGLLDRAVPASQRAAIGEVLSRYEAQGAKFHALRTRQAAGRSFVSVHVLVPGAWTVQRGHELLEEIERDIRVAVPNAAVLTHLEPVEDPTSFLDGELDR